MGFEEKVPPAHGPVAAAVWVAAAAWAVAVLRVAVAGTLVASSGEVDMAREDVGAVAVVAVAESYSAVGHTVAVAAEL